MRIIKETYGNKSAMVLFILLITSNLLWLTSSVFREEPSTNAVSAYPFLAKRIMAESQNDILINFIALRQQLRGYGQLKGDKLGIYFEYLPSGTSIGVNEGLEINIASLLKVPTAMAVYKEYEKGTLSKNNLLTVQREHLDSKFGDLYLRGEGQKISVNEAIRLSLKNSDNTAFRVLLNKLPESALTDVAESLDIPQSKKNGYLTISPKNYSSILRSLYLSSYLERANSNEILSILSGTDFKDQLEAGVEPGIKVAHKTGVYTEPTAEGITASHYSDCGIIYVPDRPYLLCVMANASLEKANEYIKTVSKMTYEYVSRAR